MTARDATRDESIQVGDMVVMVRGHDCLYQRKAGVPFVVTGFVRPKGGGWTCGYCKQRSVGADEPGALGLLSKKKVTEYSAPAIPISWLKRIPPLAELESEKTQEDIREPA